MSREWWPDLIRARVPIPLRKAKEAEFVSFTFPEQTTEDVAILFPGWEKQENPFVRIHSECLTGDVFGSKRCDCNDQLHEAIDRMTETGGIILYLRQEGRNIGLYNKLDAYNLQINSGMDTFEANTHLGFPEDARSYEIAALMLKDLGADHIRLLTNNPGKSRGLASHGVHIHETVTTGSFANDDNVKYLQAKRKHGHLLAG